MKTKKKEAPQDQDAPPSQDVAVVPPSAAARIYSHVPQNLTEAMAFAKMLADSDLVPRDYKGKPGNCLIAMQYGAELGLPPLQAIQSIAVINGKPAIYGDLGKALLLRAGCKIEERDVPETKTKGQAWCRITRPDGHATERTFSVDDAKTAGLWAKQGPWTNYPYRQMGWRAFWFAARDAAADILKGLAGAEELRDIVETTAEPAPPAEIESPAAPAPAATSDAPASKGSVATITPEERKHIFEMLEEFDVSRDTLLAYLRERYSIESTNDLTASQYAAVCRWIEEGQSELDD